MTVHVSEAELRHNGRVPEAKLGIYDCDIHPMLRKSSDILDYLPTKWQDYARGYMDFLRTPFMGASPYPKSSPALSRRDAWPPNGGPPGSDLAFMREQHLDLLGVECGILQPLFPNASKQRHIDFAVAMCRAVNEWQQAEWTSQEPRLKASIVVAQEDPQAAVEEIERWSTSSDFVQILLSPRTDEPLGRRHYWPIYEAANRLNIPLGIHVGGISGRPSTAGGHPSFHIEDYQSHIQAVQALAASLVLGGVLERFPRLRILFIEAGIAWLPSLAWRLDRVWEKQKDEVPDVVRPPSEYIRESFWFTTQPIDEPERPSQLRDVFDWVGWDRVLFATDYPHWDSDDPRYAIKFAASESERRAIFRDNARQFYQAGA